jgi:hypothetical protein
LTFDPGNHLVFLYLRPHLLNTEEPVETTGSARKFHQNKSKSFYANRYFSHIGRHILPPVIRRVAERDDAWGITMPRAASSHRQLPLSFSSLPSAGWRRGEGGRLRRKKKVWSIKVFYEVLSIISSANVI